MIGFREVEAKDRWCPFAGVHRATGESCIAARCMMWRWVMQASDTKAEDRRGFCGLAGVGRG